MRAVGSKNNYSKNSIKNSLQSLYRISHYRTTLTSTFVPINYFLMYFFSYFCFSVDPSISCFAKLSTNVVCNGNDLFEILFLKKNSNMIIIGSLKCQSHFSLYFSTIIFFFFFSFSFYSISRVQLDRFEHNNAFSSTTWAHLQSNPSKSIFPEIQWNFSFFLFSFYPR